MKKLLIYSLLPLAAIATACGDDDPVSPEQGGNEVIDNPQTAEQQKVHIDNTAKEFLTYLKPEEQKDFLDVANYFVENFGDLELPENFEFDDESDSYSPAAFMKALRRGVRNSDPGEITRAATVYHYTISFDKIRGIYVPQGDEWVKTGNSADLVFRFTDRNGSPVELKAIASTQTSNVTVDIEDYDEWWNGNGYTYEEYVNSYKLSIPQTMNVTLSRGGTTLANIQTVSQISVQGHNLSCDVNGTVANLNVTGKVNGTDSRINCEATMSVGGRVLVSGNATVNGSNLCDKNKYDNADEDDLAAMFKDGTFASDVLGKVQVRGNCRMSNALLEAFDGDWDSYEYDSKATAERLAENAKITANQNITASLFTNGSTTPAADLTFTVGQYTWGYGDYQGWEYYLEPMLKFNDGTTYSFEEYFEDSFEGSASQLNSLLDAYMNLWESFR